MPTLTTTEQVLYSGPAATVTVDNTGSGVAWVRWEGGLEMVAGPDAPCASRVRGARSTDPRSPAPLTSPWGRGADHRLNIG